MGILDQDSLNRETCCRERDAVRVSDTWCGSDSYPHNGPVSGRLPWHTRPIGRAPSLPSSRTPRLRVALPIAGPDNLGLCVTADPCSPGQPSAPRWPTIAFVFWFNKNCASQPLDLALLDFIDEVTQRLGRLRIGAIKHPCLGGILNRSGVLTRGLRNYHLRHLLLDLSFSNWTIGPGF